MRFNLFFLSIILVAAGTGWLARTSSSDVDEDIRSMLVNSDLNVRLQAARRLASKIDRPTVDQVSSIAGVLAAAREQEMRCAAADIFGAMASRSQYRSRAAHSQPELTAAIAALQRAAVYEQCPDVKICIMRAAGEFNSKEILVVLEIGKKDLDYRVRDAAVDAERARAQRVPPIGTGAQ